ncbi:MAG: GGDEF domain-containing protein, partial [Proteobacteria bacterium]|nr:GGDEF domain-containing protein [Pseudomonadota bacterium]
MNKNMAVEYERLKKDFFEAERIGREEKESLLKIINTYSKVIAMHPEFEEELQAINTIITTNQTVSPESIEKEIGNLRSKIFAKETERGIEEDGALELHERLFMACRIIKRILVALLDDFYPLSGELKENADAIQIDCHMEVAQNELAAAETDFLKFIKGLKVNISKDFRHVNSTFLMLLEEVKSLEKELSSEFDENIRQKEIEQFEKKVNDEVGSIADLFDIHATMDEMKQVVLERLSKVRKLVSERKEEEMQRIRKAFGVINKLKKRVVDTEKDANEMARKAKHFQMAAESDGLTGLYNRSAFDVRIKDALQEFSENGAGFSIVLFDINDFKWINDTFGHVAGDKVLQKVAQCLKSTFRKTDFIARYGGDEFVVVVEGLSEEMARGRI